jgi:hypothetical protein
VTQIRKERKKGNEERTVIRFTVQKLNGEKRYGEHVFFAIASPLSGGMTKRALALLFFSFYFFVYARVT